MRVTMRIACALLLIALTATAADWVCSGGDALHSGWQKHESALNPDSVKALRLIWKLPLGSSASSPVILGRMVTPRGSVELIYLAAAAGYVFAVDGYFRKVFWKRHIGAAAPTPVIAPAPQGQDEQDDDATQPLRPIYVLGSDGLLQA